MRNRDIVLAVMVGLVWGFNFVVIRWGIEAMHPATMTCLRFLFTAFPLIFFVPKPDVPIKYVVLYGVIFGLGVWELANIAIALGMRAGTTSLLLQLSPFLSVIVGACYFKEKLTTKKILGIVIAMVGFTIFIAYRADKITLLPIILMFFSAFFWTICNAIIKVTKPLNVLSFTIWSSVFVPIPIFAVSLVYMVVNDMDVSVLLTLPSLNGWLSVLFQAVVTTLFGYTIWTRLISKYGLVTIAPFSLLVPVSALLFGWLIYDEKLTVMQFFGSLCILFSLYLLTLKNSAS